MHRRSRTNVPIEHYARKLEEHMEELQGSDDLHTMKQREFEFTPDTSRLHQGEFKAIFEHSPLAIMSTDQSGTINTCNANATILFGAPAEKLIGFSHREIEDLAMKKAIEAAFSGKISRFEGEYFTVTGKVHTYMKANFGPSYLPDGSISGIIGIFEDITERILKEKERERLIQSLREELAGIRKHGGFLPICACCKGIRTGDGDWHQIEDYLRDHFDMRFSHSICPKCSRKLYPHLQLDE